MTPRGYVTKTALGRLLTTVALLIATCFPVHLLFAQWTPSNGPYGGTVWSLSVVPGTGGPPTLFAGTETAGVFRSLDNGNTWTSTSTGLTALFIPALVSYPNPVGGTILLAGTMTGIFRSTDLGDSWTDFNNGLTTPDSRAITSLCVAPDGAGGTTLYAATFQGMFRSTDAGAGWIPADSGMAPNIANDIYRLAAIDNGSGGSYIFAGGQNYGLYISTDNGSSWLIDTAGLAYAGIRGLVACGGYMFVGTSGKGMLRIARNGTSWTPANNGLASQNGLNVTAVASGPNGSGGANIIVSTFDGIYVSPDTGATWVPLKNGISTPYAVALAVAANGSGGVNLFAGTIDQGIYRLPNNSTTWSAANTGLAASTVQALAISTGLPGPTTLFAGTRGGAFRSTDDGLTWTPINNGLSSPDELNIYSLGLISDGSGGMRIFAGTNAGLSVSSNGGTFWSPVNGFVNVPIHSMSVYGRDLLLQGSFLSTDYGASWKLTGGSPGPSAILPNGSTGIYLYNIAQVSADSGRTWNDVSGTWNTLNHGTGQWWKVTAAAVNGTDLIVGTGDGIFLSANAGAGWSTLNNGLKDTAVCSFLTGPDVFVGTDSGGVFVLTNFGTTWKGVNTGLPYYDILALTQSGSTLFAGTGGRALWRRPLSEMPTGIGLQTAGTIPAGYSLEQNYPNPFNPSTTITYSVPSAVPVTVKVFDLLGREVATLVNETRQPGSYLARWDASTCASGTYFIRMQAGTFAQARKVVLIR